MAGGPSRPRRSRCLLPAKSPPLSCSRSLSNRVSDTTAASPSFYPPPRLLQGCPHRCLPAPCSQGPPVCRPRALSPPGAAADSGGGRYVPRGLLLGRALLGLGEGEEWESGGATPNHTGLAWEDSLLGGRVGAVNPASPAGESGWENVYFSGGVGVLTRRKRGSPGLTPWEGHAGRGGVGGTPELHIAVGVDDNLTLLPSTSLGVELGVGGLGLPRIFSGSQQMRDSRRPRAPFFPAPAAASA